MGKCMTANELADWFDGRILYLWDAEDGQYYDSAIASEIVPTLRQQQAEIEALKNANRFIQNFAEEQHQRAVALEMRELTDEEIISIGEQYWNGAPFKFVDFARAILRKANEK